MKWNLKKIKVSELKEFEKNPRKLTEKGLADLKKSIKRFGLAEPLVINTDNIICGGHGRLRIIKELGIEEVDCYMPVKTLTGKEFKELNIRLNANIAGIFDYDLLEAEWDVVELGEWGLDYDFNIDDNIDFENIKSNENREKTFKDELVTCPYCEKSFNIKI